MVIIGILVTAVLAISTTLINKAKTQNTQAVLGIVRHAIEEFSRQQTDQPTLTRATQVVSGTEWVRYVDRYGNFPPDELEPFTPVGLPGSAGGPSLAVGGANMVPAPGGAGGYDDPMTFHQDGLSLSERALEHRDLAALIVAIELFSEPASVILAGIPKRNWAEGPLDVGSGQPVQFLDRDLGGDWDVDDFQIRYIVDDWGIPISYLAQRDYDPAAPPAVSSNHSDWNQSSTEMIRLNGGQPIIMSYGPDGKDQLTLEAMGNAGAGEASLVADWMDDDPDPHRIDHPLNADNVYADQALNEKLAKGLSR